MSDVTAEEVRAELSKAAAVADAWYRSKAAVFGDGFGNALVDVIATALAVRAREARREALREAMAAVDGCSDLYDATGAIRALLGPET